MLTLKMPRKMSFAKEQDSKFIITMNRIQQEVMHAVNERFQDLETYNIRGVPEVPDEGLRPFARPRSAEEKVRVGLCGSVAN